MKLTEIKKGDRVTGLEGNTAAEILSVDALGDNLINIVYRNSEGILRERTLSSEDAANISEASGGRAWDFSADGEEFKLALEAQRIRLAHLFDPLLAVHTSNVEPLPHQISSVYESMLPRQPLRVSF